MPALTLPAPPRCRATTYGLDPSAYRFSLAQYDRMVESGILTPEDRVELLEGYLVTKMGATEPHDVALNLVSNTLLRLMPAGWTWRAQQAIALANSKPEPDFALVRGGIRDYRHRKPGPADFGILVEISDSSLARDRDDKLPLYAEAGIPIYWIVNIPDSCVEIHEQPTGSNPNPGYAVNNVYRTGDMVPIVLDGVTLGTVPAADLIP